jgi:hypothetical protein
VLWRIGQTNKRKSSAKDHQQELLLSVRSRIVILSPCLLEHLPCSDQLESFYRSLSEQIAYRVVFPLGGLTQARHHPTRY